MDAERLYDDFDAECFRQTWIDLVCQFMDDQQLSAQRAVQTAKLGLEREGMVKFANDMAYWQDVERAAKLFKYRCRAWARRHVK